jgi:hypothetical protein
VWVAAAGLAAAILLAALPALRADQVPNPIVTASANPYSAAYTASNLFLPGRNEFATAGQGPCSGPLVTDPGNGTWVELDFGADVTFDRFIMGARYNAADLVGTNVLYVGDNPVHSTKDTIFTFSTAGDNGSAPIHNLGSVTGRYVRWEVLSGKAGGNLGGRHIWFLNSPANMTVLTRPVVLSATDPFSATYAAAQAEDGKCGNDNSGEEYAINGSVSGATGTTIVFDFGSTNIVISGFDFLNREVDLNTSFTLTFGNDPTFTVNLATNTFNANPTNGNAWLTATFPRVTARYVQFQADAAVQVGSANTPNPGMREMVFYGPAGQPPIIVDEPPSETNYVGDIASLSVTASGSLPLAYQWFTNGAPLAGATNSQLTFNDLPLSAAASYVVVVTNLYGSATSTPAIMVVSNPPVNLQAGLVVHYAFDETSGATATDSSGNGNDGTLYNYPDETSMWVPGRIGNALAFNLNGTVDEYVATDGALTFADTDNFSFSFWEKLGSTDNPYNPRIVTPEGDYWVLWTPNVGLGFYPPAASPGPQLGVWTHYVVTYNRPNGIYSLYVNGVKVLNNVQSGSYVKPVSDLQNPWIIGHGETLKDVSDSWKGYLDDLYIYNRVIYPSEALALYQLAPLEPPTFTVGLRNQSLFVGQTLNLSATVNGTPPISYQWQWNGSDIPGAVSEQLVINNVQLTNAGTYTLTASNSVQTASSTAVITVQQVTSVTNGLGGYWKFDEKTGDTAFDSSGTRDNGTIFNTLNDGGQWTNGLVGGALDFRGSATGADDYVTISNWPVASSGNMTFAVWVLAQALPDTNLDIACGGSGADGTGQFVLSVVPGYVNNHLSGSVQDKSGNVYTVTAGSTFPTNAWQHVALVAGTNSVILYQNGVVVASTLFDGSLSNPTNVMSLGALMAPGDTGAQSGWWQGLMDEAAYWTRALSSKEVFELVAVGEAGSAITSADSFSNSPPIIGVPPQGGTVYLDNPFTFQVGAAGPSALSYQWTRNGTPISGATNTTYALAAAGFSDAASYAAVVSCVSGSVTSTPAVLTINAPLPAQDSGLVLYLKLDDAQGSTNALDSTLNADNGTLMNFFAPVTNWVPGIIKGALLFSAGVQNYEAVAVPDQPYLDFGTASFSLSFWAKGTPLQISGGGLICKGLGGGGESYCVDLYPSPGTSGPMTYRFFDRNSVGAVTTPQIFGVPCNGNWQHIAVIGDYVAGQASMYIDGVFMGAVVLPPDGLLANSSTLDIGARQYQGGYTLPFNGLMDDIRVYDRAITPIEVRALYYQGNPPELSIEKSATVSWPFEAMTTYHLESSTNLFSWSPVAGVTTNFVTLSSTNASMFYRLLRTGNGE